MPRRLQNLPTDQIAKKARHGLSPVKITHDTTNQTEPGTKPVVALSVLTLLFPHKHRVAELQLMYSLPSKYGMGPGKDRTDKTHTNKQQSITLTAVIGN